MFKAAALCTIILALPLSASALVYGGSNLGYSGYPSNDCTKPIKPTKPYSFDSKWEIRSYNSQVDEYNIEYRRYVSCIKEYIDNANNDIRRIKEKIQEAIDEVRNGI